MGRRVDVKPNNVAQLRHELGVGGELEPADAVRLEAVSLPDALHRGDADAGRSVARLAGRLGKRQDNESAPPPPVGGVS
jgi:hypothetical protein